MPGDGPAEVWNPYRRPRLHQDETRIDPAAPAVYHDLLCCREPRPGHLTRHSVPPQAPLATLTPTVCWHSVGRPVP